MERGDKVWVTYGGGLGMVAHAYKGKLVAEIRPGEWIVRECWTLNKRVIRESSIVLAGKEAE